MCRKRCALLPQMSAKRRFIVQEKRCAKMTRFYGGGRKKKISRTYFKIQGTYFEICPTFFCAHLTCLFFSGKGVCFFCLFSKFTALRLRRCCCFAGLRAFAQRSCRLRGAPWRGLSRRAARARMRGRTCGGAEWRGVAC